MMRRAWRLAAIALIFAVAGCASTPQASRERDADAKSFDAHPGAATIYVYRSPFDTEVDHNILYIDGRLIGSTVPGTYFRVHVTPGKHTLHGVGVDLGQLTVDMRPGALYFVDLSVIAGHSRYHMVPPDRGRSAIERCCVLLENWAPGQRPLLR